VGGELAKRAQLVEPTRRGLGERSRRPMVFGKALPDLVQRFRRYEKPKTLQPLGHRARREIIRHRQPPTSRRFTIQAYRVRATESRKQSMI
jgi:hypothetical protein